MNDITTTQEESESVIKLEYYPVIRKIFWIIIFVLVIIELLIFRIHFAQLFSEGMLKGLISFLLLSSIPLGIFLRLMIFVRPRIFSHFELDANDFFICRAKKKNGIHYSQIKNVSISKLSPRFFGGFIIQLNTGQKLRFPSLLKHNELILKRALKYNKELIAEDKANHYFAIQSMVIESWNRIRRKLQNKSIIAIKYFAIPLILSFIHSKTINSNVSFGELLLIYSLANLVYALIFNSIEERIYVSIYNAKGVEYARSKELILEYCIQFIYLIMVLSNFYAILQILSKT